MATETTCPPLMAYRVHLSDGTSYVTSMAAGVTLDDARAYFVGQSFEQSDGRMLAAVAVEPAWTYGAPKPCDQCGQIVTPYDIARAGAGYGNYVYRCKCGHVERGAVRVDGKTWAR